ncbi:MAG: HYExAFE family protein [Oligoflexia bacterium]|nr:HYExAFE family protein [Oligoflexia bacterium]
MRRSGNHSHYENAVEAYLKENNYPYISTLESRRVAYNGGTIKNFDFILPGRKILFMDIKGRKFGYASTPGNTFENWILLDDISSLTTWSSLSSSNQQAYLLYAFCLPDMAMPLPKVFIGNSFVFNEKVYAFLAITIEDYIKNSKKRSIKPPACCVSRKLFATLVTPLFQILIENKI